MSEHRWTCARGHVRTVDASGSEVATGIAARATQRTFDEGGCDVWGPYGEPDKRGVPTRARCGAAVAHTGPA